MGMYDTINVSEQLPYTDEMKELGLDCNNLSYQTKDLECCLNVYFIQDKKLYLQQYKNSEYVEGDKNSKNWIDRLGHMKQTDPYLEEIFHHGEVYFYDYINDVADKYDCWVEYKAVFTRGVLEKIELFKFEKEDNTERKNREKKYKEKYIRENNIWYNKYIFHTRPYMWFANKVWYRTCNRIGNFFHTISHKL